ncbi:BTAD domain-containing putative transcriptional regulator [Kutzneria sp. NPDC052558]|uniref:BTAD domain-containing putative transcriptional regulator n=1 Tax=Kutzneria sp. NPDC052558 TaxID=3364121 RepID=UPI0037C528CF
MEFRVLGPLEVWTDQGRLPLPAVRHQRVLATLLLAPNSVVATTKLVEATWDDEPPATAVKQIQNAVSALRDRLGDTGQQIIATDGSGYRITVDEDQLDLLRFTRGIADARRLAERGALRDGVREIRAALKLWRGPILDGQGSDALTRRTTRLEEQRLAAIESCVDWQLALGQHREVLDDLIEITDEHPLRERPHAQLMLALDRAGRSGEALAVYQRLRAALAEELGIDPGPELRRLHEQILRGENHLAPETERPRDKDDRAGQLDRAAQELAAAITRQWTAEAEVRSLNRPEPVPLRWSSTEREVAAVASTVLGARPGEGPERLVLSGDLTDVVAKFRQVPARQLVVLGEPGAGKSVLAILLTLGLLADPPAGEPVPVLLPLASWDPHTEHLHAWLARKLVEEYPGLANTAAYGKDAAMRLVLGNRIIPVLDGLDETPPALHTAAIDALDRAAAGGRPLVVTCRSAEYEDAVQRTGAFLTRAAVVEIEPVEPEDALAFLTARRRLGETRWRPIADRLRRDPTGALAQALRTPLMVDLTRTAYADPARDPAELCDPERFPDRASIERHLLDSYLPAVYPAQPPPPDRPARFHGYRLDQAERWLGFLARPEQHDLAWWRLDRTEPRLAMGLCLGLPPALLFALTGWLAAGPWLAAVYGVSFGAAGFVTHTFGRRPGPLRVEARFHGTAGRFARRFAVGAIIGTALCLGWSLPAGAIALFAGVFGLAVGVHVWLDTPMDADRVASPLTVLRHDRAATLLFTASFMVSLGLFFALALLLTPDESGIEILDGRYDLELGLAGGVAGGLLGHFFVPRLGGVAYGLAGAVIGGQIIPAAAGLPQALLPGALFGLSVGLSVCLSRAWGTFAMTRLWLASRGRIPWRLLPFLDDAHRRGVLRQVGAVYQFRHARLRERLVPR